MSFSPVKAKSCPVHRFGERNSLERPEMWERMLVSSERTEQNWMQKSHGAMAKGQGMSSSGETRTNQTRGKLTNEMSLGLEA